MQAVKGLLPFRTGRVRALLVLISLYAAPTSVSADVLVNFNSLSTSADSGAIGTNISHALGFSAIVSGATVTHDYNGDGHVVGTATNSNSVTLGSDGGNFLITQNVGGMIVIKLAKPVYALRFDMEIFPDITSNSTPPDFTFNAFANPNDANPLVSATFIGVLPDPSLRSPADPNGNEHYMQLLQTGVTYTFPTGATTFQFVDWPPTIGIDNLAFQLDAPTAVPEPATLLLLAGGLAGAGVFARVRRGTREIKCRNAKIA